MDIQAYYEVSARKWQFLLRIDREEFENLEKLGKDTDLYQLYNLLDELVNAKNKALPNGS